MFQHATTKDKQTNTFNSSIQGEKLFTKLLSGE